MISKRHRLRCQRRCGTLKADDVSPETSNAGLTAGGMLERHDNLVGHCIDSVVGRQRQRRLQRATVCMSIVDFAVAAASDGTQAGNLKRRRPQSFAARE